MVPHVQLSINCGLGCFSNKTKKSLHQQPIFSRLTTAQVVDPLPLYKDFPDLSLYNLLLAFLVPWLVLLPEVFKWVY
jgi:hypothetical protein